MAKWNIREETGKSYVYVSKNATSDVPAANFFGKAAAWVSGASYAIGDRVTSVSIQYKNKTGVNTSTAPASDATNWEFDFENYQTYSTIKSYTIGAKTNYANEHYNCIGDTSGTFNPAKWNKVIISNKDVPYMLMNTAVNLINGDARFVSSEILDCTLNKAYHNIHLILSNGVWSETLTNPTKYIRVVGQSKWKTKLLSTHNSLFYYNNLGGLSFNGSYVLQRVVKCSNCIVESILGDNYNSTWFLFSFSYKNIFKVINGSGASEPNTFNHFVSNIVLQFSTSANKYSNSSVFKNNYLKGTTINLGSLTELQKIPLGNIDYNFYEGTIQVGGVTQTSIAMLQTTLPNQNIYSIKGTATLNSDYTLPVGSPLIEAGSNGNNIGAEGLGYVDTTSTIFSTANGAIYKNLKVTGTYIERDQISKLAQAGGVSNITLNSDASGVDGEYNGFRIYISSGTGVGQIKTISAYDGTTKVATVSEAWTTVPDSTSVYEIMDGQITSAIGDLGSIQVISKMNFDIVNQYKVGNLIIDQSVSMSDARLDHPAGLTYDLKCGNVSDLAGSSFRRFAQYEPLEVDSSDRGNGDANFDAQNIVSQTLSFRYYQVMLNFTK